MRETQRKTNMTTLHVKSQVDACQRDRDLEQVSEAEESGNQDRQRPVLDTASREED